MTPGRKTVLGNGTGSEKRRVPLILAFSLRSQPDASSGKFIFTDAHKERVPPRFEFPQRIREVFRLAARDELHKRVGIGRIPPAQRDARNDGGGRFGVRARKPEIPSFEIPAAAQAALKKLRVPNTCENAHDHRSSCFVMESFCPAFLKKFIKILQSVNTFPVWPPANVV